jgi:hypothetical protein
MTFTSIAPAAPIRAYSRRSGLPVQLAPSASVAGKYHLVSGQGCDCKGYSYRRTCRHFVAFQAERGLQDGGAAHLQVLRAAGQWPS